jgi:hypothetical protein
MTIECVARGGIKSQSKEPSAEHAEQLDTFMIQVPMALGEKESGFGELAAVNEFIRQQAVNESIRQQMD